ncbi:MAG TPA: peptidase, partial [Lacipirellulaceae bacterium]|nr:peptidase [Lacipirellulaceae bacterium]
AQLGDDSVRIAADDQRAIRRDESQWLPGKFVHPHDACFDAEGNILVAEWVGYGRVTKLTRLG